MKSIEPIGVSKAKASKVKAKGSDHAHRTRRPCFLRLPATFNTPLELEFVKGKGTLRPCKAT